jgi:hypothetical protein
MASFKAFERSGRLRLTSATAPSRRIDIVVICGADWVIAALLKLVLSVWSLQMESIAHAALQV